MLFKLLFDIPVKVNKPPEKSELKIDVPLKETSFIFAPLKNAELILEFQKELQTYGRVYMYRFRPNYDMYARPISDYPGRCEQAKSIMLMIQNNLDYAVAQHPHELITYGGNGAVFPVREQLLRTARSDHHQQPGVLRMG